MEELRWFNLMLTMRGTLDSSSNNSMRQQRKMKSKRKRRLKMSSMAFTRPRRREFVTQLKSRRQLITLSSTMKSLFKPESRDHTRSTIQNGKNKSRRRPKNWNSK